MGSRTVSAGKKDEAPVVVSGFFPDENPGGSLEVERSVELSTSIGVTSYMWIGVKSSASVRGRCDPENYTKFSQSLDTQAFADAYDSIHTVASVWKDGVAEVKRVLEERWRPAK